MSKMDEVFDLVVRGKAKLIGAAVQEALDEGNAAPDVLDNMIKAMGVVGERFKNNEIFVPEMLVAARAMKKAVDVPIEKFVEAVRENPDVKVVGVSALLTTTMPAMKDTVEALNKEDFRKNIKIMVGGAPITQEFADEIGADAYTADAATAAQVAKQLVA